MTFQIGFKLMNIYLDTCTSQILLIEQNLINSKLSFYIFTEYFIYVLYNYLLIKTFYKFFIAHIINVAIRISFFNFAHLVLNVEFDLFFIALKILVILIFVM